MLSMESSQIWLQVLEKLCVEYGKLSDIATGNCVLSKNYVVLSVVYGKLSDIATGTGKTMC